MEEIIVKKDLKSAKLLGGIGLLLSFLPIFIGPLISLIMVVIAVKKLANLTQRKEIFGNYLKGVVFSIIGLAFFGIGALITFITLGSRIIPLIRDLSPQGDAMSPFVFPYALFAFKEITITLIMMAILAIIAYICVIVGAYFKKKSYNMITEETTTGLFKTAGELHFIGSILLVVPITMIGVAIHFIAYILEIIAFFSLPEELPHKVSVNTAQPQSFGGVL